MAASLPRLPTLVDAILSQHLEKQMSLILEILGIVYLAQMAAVAGIIGMVLWRTRERPPVYMKQR